MKKLFLTMAIFCFMVFIPTLQAEEKTAQKASTLIVLKNDLVEPEEGESYHKQSLAIYCHNDNWFGGGISMDIKPKYDYIKIKPFFTVNKGPLYLLGGLSTDSTGNDYLQTGAWYVNKFGKTKVFFDLRNYWNTSGDSSDYLDVFLEVEYPLGERFYAGLDLIYDHYWQDENNRNFYLIGPYAGYKVTDNVSIYLRLSRNWNVTSDSSDRTDNIRGGLKIVF